MTTNVRKYPEKPSNNYVDVLVLCLSKIPPPIWVILLLTVFTVFVLLQ